MGLYKVLRISTNQLTLRTSSSYWDWRISSCLSWLSCLVPISNGSIDIKVFITGGTASRRAAKATSEMRTMVMAKHLTDTVVQHGASFMDGTDSYSGLARFLHATHAQCNIIQSHDYVARLVWSIGWISFIDRGVSFVTITVAVFQKIVDSTCTAADAVVIEIWFSACRLSCMAKSERRGCRNCSVLTMASA